MTTDDMVKTCILVVQYLFVGRVSTYGSLLSPTGGVKGNEPCTSYSRTFTIHNYGYGIAYTFTHNNITLEHTAMNDKNTIAHTDAHKHAVLSTLRAAR